MAVLTIPGWLGWGQRGRGRREQQQSVRMNRRRGVSMGSRKRAGGGSRLLVNPRETLILILRTVAVGLVVLMLAALAGWASSRPMFQIQRVVVSGDLQQVDRELVVKRVRSLHGNFFTFDLRAAAAELRTLPWVHAVSMRRLWPNGMEVEVEENQPLARWADEGLLNVQGEPFAADYAGALPRFDGPAGSGAEMAREFQEFNRELAPVGRKVEALGLSERRAWTIRLEDGLTISLGRDSIHERLVKFVSAYPLLFKKESTQGAVADLRYASGFTLRTLVTRR
jgi:cell division protein FtsQ